MLMRATLMVSLMWGLPINSFGQTRPINLQPGSVEAKALAFFEQIEERNVDDYLKRIRLPQVAPAFKAQVLARITKGEAIRISGQMQAALAALAPILKYHERDSVIEIRVIGVRELFIGLQGRAVLLISEKALNLLPIEELQAVVAHELGHEYFWGALMEAHRQQQGDVTREIELRCDGIAVITLHRLGLDPAKLVSALTRIRAFNTQTVATNPFYHPTPDERARFIHAVRETVRQRVAALTQSTARPAALFTAESSRSLSRTDQ